MIFNVVANILLIPHYGYEGACAAISVARVFLFVSLIGKDTSGGGEYQYESQALS